MENECYQWGTHSTLKKVPQTNSAIRRLFVADLGELLSLHLYFKDISSLFSCLLVSLPSANHIHIVAFVFIRSCPIKFFVCFIRNVFPLHYLRILRWFIWERCWNSVHYCFIVMQSISQGNNTVCTSQIHYYPVTKIET